MSLQFTSDGHVYHGFIPLEIHTGIFTGVHMLVIVVFDGEHDLYLIDSLEALGEIKRYYDRDWHGTRDLPYVVYGQTVTSGVWPKESVVLA